MPQQEIPFGETALVVGAGAVSALAAFVAANRLVSITPEETTRRQIFLDALAVGALAGTAFGVIRLTQATKFRHNGS